MYHNYNPNRISFLKGGAPPPGGWALDALIGDTRPDGPGFSFRRDMPGPDWAGAAAAGRHPSEALDAFREEHGGPLQPWEATPFPSGPGFSFRDYHAHLAADRAAREPTGWLRRGRPAMPLSGHTRPAGDGTAFQVYRPASAGPPGGPARGFASLRGVPPRPRGSVRGPEDYSHLVPSPEQLQANLRAREAAAAAAGSATGFASLGGTPMQRREAAEARERERLSRVDPAWARMAAIEARYAAAAAPGGGDPMDMDDDGDMLDDLIAAPAARAAPAAPAGSCHRLTSQAEIQTCNSDDGEPPIDIVTTVPIGGDDGSTPFSSYFKLSPSGLCIHEDTYRRLALPKQDPTNRQPINCI